jgi:predicted ATPase
MIPEAKLGAYRDNEVSPAHPFILTVEDLKKTGKTSIMPLMQFKSILKTTKIL